MKCGYCGHKEHDTTCSVVVGLGYCRCSVKARPDDPGWVEEMREAARQRLFHARKRVAALRESLSKAMADADRAAKEFEERGGKL